MNTDSVLKVGSGRGFVMEHRVYFDFGDGRGYRKLRRKVVVTAAHCLPHAPKVISKPSNVVILADLLRLTAQAEQQG